MQSDHERQFEKHLVCKGLMPETVRVQLRRLRFAVRHGLDPGDPDTWDSYYLMRSGQPGRCALVNDAKLLNLLAQHLGVERHYPVPGRNRRTRVALQPRHVNALVRYRGTSRLEQMRARALFQVDRKTGMRRGELQRLRVQDIDWSRGRVFVHASKGGPDRWVPAETALFQRNGPLATWLRNRRGSCPNVFSSLKAPYGSLGVEAVGQILWRMRKRCGIEGPVSSRVLRHTRITELFREYRLPAPHVAYMHGVTIPTLDYYSEVGEDDCAALLRQGKPRHPRKSCSCKAAGAHAPQNPGLVGVG